jgi:hypothetical protein
MNHRKAYLSVIKNALTERDKRIQERKDIVRGPNGQFMKKQAN